MLRALSRADHSKYVGSLFASLLSLSAVSAALPVVYHPAYTEKWQALPPGERAAMASAVEKLRIDSQLGFPHTSLARGGRLAVRELRPRRGRSPWRGLYRRLG
jgi:hypothetical protein